MRIARNGRRLAYSGRRLPPEPTRSYRISVEIGRKLERPGRLERFLTARWGLHVDWYGRTLHLPNAHPAWPLHTARVHHLEEDLIRAAGLPAPQGPPCSVLYSPGVPVVFGTPEVAQGGDALQHSIETIAPAA
jgi:uncharacterized protein YqjF (DUF2071 family)